MMFKPKPSPVTEGEPIPPVSATPSLVDTSVIIDGRIADIARAGFAPGQLLIPRFVLAELQLIADSGDAMKRSRGRRGLEMLTGMREAGVDMEVIEYDYDDIKEVDAKLVRLGRHLKCNVLTTDYNLNRVASIEGVRVLNINELANAVRPVILPGERMHTKIVQSGKERGQGVGYLADGTMIVVDGGDKLTGQDVEVEITRVFQTVAGKMLFAMVVPGQVMRSHDRGQAAGQSQAQKPAQNPGQRPPANPNPRQGQGQRPRGGQGGHRRQTGNQQSQPQPTGGSAPKHAATGSKASRSNNGASADRPPQASANGKANPQGGNGDNGGSGRRPKRVNPTQRLEDSLLKMTQGDQNTTNNN